MKTFLRQIIKASLLMFSGSGTALANGLAESWGPDNPNFHLAVMGGLLVLGVLQLLLFAWRRHDQARGALGLFCLYFPLWWTLADGRWPPALTELLEPIAFAVTVPLLMLYVQALYPQKWFHGMILYTWAYVIPYAVIIMVYPIEQLRPIVPAMQKFSGLSLLATLFASYQWVQHKQKGALLLLLSLVLLVPGLFLKQLTAPSVLLFIGAQALLLFRRADNAGLPRP